MKKLLTICSLIISSFFISCELEIPSINPLNNVNATEINNLLGGIEATNYMEETPIEFKAIFENEELKVISDYKWEIRDIFDNVIKKYNGKEFIIKEGLPAESYFLFLTIVDVDNNKRTFKTSFEVKSRSTEEINNRRAEAISKIKEAYEGYAANKSDYNSENWSILENLYNKSLSELENSKSIKKIEQIEEETLTSMQNVSTIKQEQEASEEAEAFRQNHKEILEKEYKSLKTDDKDTVNAALNDFKNLSGKAQSLLEIEKDLLEELSEKVNFLIEYGLLGHWEFKHENILSATYGNDLAWEGSGSWNKLDSDHWKNENCGIGVAEGISLKATYETDEMLTSYTLIFDFKYVDKNWKSFYQTNLSNSEDGELFIHGKTPTGALGKDNPNTGKIGVGDFNYSSSTVAQSSWQRLIIVKDVNIYKVYIDGVLYLESDKGDAERFNIAKDGLLFLADNNNEDTYIFITGIRIYTKPLTEEQRNFIGNQL